jgi:hypothetical protein
LVLPSILPVFGIPYQSNMFTESRFSNPENNITRKIYKKKYTLVLLENKVLLVVLCKSNCIDE